MISTSSPAPAPAPGAYGTWHAPKVVLRQLETNNHRDWELLEPLVYELPNGSLIEAPVGLVTDQASVPRLLWAKYPPSGRWSAAAIVHDYLCTCHKTGLAHPAARTRREVDHVFWLCMRASGVSPRDAWIMWAAVRLAARLMGWEREGYGLAQRPSVVRRTLK